MRIRDRKRTEHGCVMSCALLWSPFMVVCPGRGLDVKGLNDKLSVTYMLNVRIGGSPLAEAGTSAHFWAA
eukprot:40089-Eustigmatos_ZCMA.PRE.1